MAQTFFIIWRLYKWEDCEIDTTRCDDRIMSLDAVFKGSNNSGEHTLLCPYTLANTYAQHQYMAGQSCPLYCFSSFWYFQTAEVYSVLHV